MTHREGIKVRFAGLKSKVVPPDQPLALDWVHRCLAAASCRRLLAVS
jgi:hypothetical protein